MKEKALFTNTDVVNEVYGDLIRKNDWFVKYRKDASEVTAYDHRDLRPMSYLLIDLSEVPEDKREESYKNELDKMIAAFDTLDPNTKKPYPDAIEPYLKRIYEITVSGMDDNIDWNDKKQVEKFIHAHLLLQSVQSMTNNFVDQFFKMYPTIEERRRLDAGIVKSQALFNRADQFFKNKNISLQAVNELTLLSIHECKFTQINEYLNVLSANALMDENKDMVIDPSVDELFTDYFLGKEIDSTDYDHIEETEEPYHTDRFEYDFWKALEGTVSSTFAESRVLNSFDKDLSSLVLIDGNPITLLVNTNGKSYIESTHIYTDLLKKALRDGKSRVEIARFGFDDAGNVSFTYQPVKLDLDKLNTLAGENKFPTNAERDEHLRSATSLERMDANHKAFEKSFIKSLDKSAPIDHSHIREKLPDFKQSESVARLSKIDNKIAELEAKVQAAAAAVQKATDDFDIHYKKNEESAARDTMHELYYMFMAKVPEDKRDDVHNMICEEFIAMNSQSIFDMTKGTFLHDNKDASQEVRDHFFFYRCGKFHFTKGLYNKLLNHVASYMDDKTIDAILEGIDNYKPLQTNNTPVYYYRATVDRIKEKNEAEIADPAQREAVNEELEKVANTVITSTQQFSLANGDSLDKICDHISSVKDEKIIKEAFEKDKYKHIKNYLDDDPVTMYAGIRHVNEKNVGNVNFPKEVVKEEHKLIVPDNVKASILKIIGLMRERNMLAYGGDGGEAGNKAYSFMQIKEATLNLRSAMDSKDPDAIRAARENYERSLENMREVYKLIEEEFHPTLKNLVGNVNNFRENWVPAEFKNSVVHNALASGIYNLALAVENGGATVEEMLENPNATVLKMIGKVALQFSPNGLYKDSKLSECMKDVLNREQRRGYPYNAFSRNIELLCQLTSETAYEEQNTVAATLIKTYDTYANSLTLTGARSSVHGYLSKGKYSTLANMFLVQEEDRDYDKLRSYEAVSCDGMSHIPPFDAMSYIEGQKLDPAAIVGRIKSTLRELHEENLFEEGLIDAIRGAQLAAYEYISVNPTPDEAFDKKDYDELRDLITDPKSVLGEMITGEVEETITQTDSMKNYIKAIESVGNKALKDARKEARKAEKSFNKQANKLVSSIKKFTKKLEKHPDNDAFKAEKERAERALDELRANELSRLEKAYTDGKLPLNYYALRAKDVESGNHGKTVPFDSKDLPSFKKFKSQYKDELSAEEIEFLYQRTVDNVKLEEKKFILAANKLQPKPRIDAAPAEPEVKVEDVDKDRAPIVLDEVKDEMSKERVSRIEADRAKEISAVEPPSRSGSVSQKE